MSSTREQIPPRRKRNHAEAELTTDSSSQPQPQKRYKLHSAEFYDSLSKLWLTRRALKELDRRTSQINRPQPAAAPRHVHQESTLKQIKRFAKHGGPDLRDLRGYPAPADVHISHTMSSSRYPRSPGSKQTKSTAPTSASSKSRRSSAYDNDFEQHLIDHSVYPKGYSYLDNRETPEPGNTESLYRILSQPRLSLSPSHFTTANFRAFERKNDGVIDEGEVMRDLIPIICGESDIPNKQNLQFTRLEPIAGGATVDGKPDFYDGARVEEIDKQVQEDLGSFIIPTRHRTAPVAPNFFLEAKAPKGAADVAKRQACYNGALGARAMHKLQSYRKDVPVYDGNGYTISTTYHAGTGTLKLYTTHPSQAPDGSTEYHMTQLRSLDLTDSADSFRQGATSVRNARDWARQQRDSFITAANQVAKLKDDKLAYETSDHSDVDDTTDILDFQGYTSSQPSTFHTISCNDEPVESQPSTFNSSDYYSNMHPNQESESSADELALNTYTTTTTSNKRNRSSARTVSKVARYEDQSSHRRHLSKT
ncbi:hypothetical protein B0O99DRAFT_678204 [Bisporella sp. PMI_857]|nr:hypothetical protein B0O99DRAFT_678204 [Bisporella sp. PMI_857]